MPSEPRETRHSRALIAHAFARAQAEGFTRAIIETHVQNTRAHALLERMGFERTASHAQDRIKWERAL